MFKAMADDRWSRSKLIKAVGETLPQAVDTLSNLLRDSAFLALSPTNSLA
jgi:hypothetical protein